MTRWGEYLDGTRDMSRDEEQSSRRWLGREGAGGESLPDRGWLADPQPTDTEEQ